MKNRIFIVTGATGHLGNTIVRNLLFAGEMVRGLVLPHDKSEALTGLSLEIIEGDVREYETLTPLFKNPDGCDLIVFHCAGVVSIASKFHQLVYDVNIKGTSNILKLCQENKVKKLVYISSVHAIPERICGEEICEVTQFSSKTVHGLYAKTKAEATNLVLRYVERGLDASIVHPSGIIGPGDYGNAHLTQLVLDYIDGKLFACVQGGYDFVDVRDVARGAIACSQLGKKGECYILSNRYYTLEELFHMLGDISGHKKTGIVLPLQAARMTAPFAEVYYKLLKRPPLFTAYSLYTLKSNSNFSHEKATRVLNYTPRNLNDTLVDTVSFLKESHQKKLLE